MNEPAFFGVCPRVMTITAAPGMPPYHRSLPLDDEKRWND
jgi:hypothetical protein